MNTYNGWTNYETWNVMLWLNNEIYLYMSMQLHFSVGVDTYKELILAMELENDSTGDGVPFLNTKLNYTELDSAIADLQENN